MGPVNILEYDHERDICNIRSMLTDEPEVIRIFENAVSSSPCAHIFTSYDGKEPAAVLILQRVNQRTMRPFVFVKRSMRRRGIGTAMLRLAASWVQASSYECLEYVFGEDRSIAVFLEKNGYNCLWREIKMERDSLMIDPEKTCDEALKKAGVEIRNYTDEDYWAYHTIVDTAFYLMRPKACSRNWYERPSNYSRQLLAGKDSCNSRYVMRKDGEAVAVCKLICNEVALLGVRPDKQHQGFGSLMLAWSVNKLIPEGHEKIAIGVLDGNPAKALYSRNGFVPIGSSCCYILFVRPDSRPSKPAGYESEEEILTALRQFGRLEEEMSDE